MYLIFFFFTIATSSYLCLCGGFGPLYINYLQTVLWSAAISSRGQFYGLESSSLYWWVLMSDWNTLVVCLVTWSFFRCSIGTPEDKTLMEDNKEGIGFPLFSKHKLMSQWEQILTSLLYVCVESVCSMHYSGNCLLCLSSKASCRVANASHRAYKTMRVWNNLSSLHMFRSAGNYHN